MNTKFFDFSFKTLIQLSEQKLCLPFYHVVNQDVPTHLKHLYPIRNPQIFEQDIQFFLRYFEPTNITELKNFSQKKCEKNLFLLSFDDGMRECYDFIAPILRKYSLKAMFFINTDFLDNKKMFFRHILSLIIEKFLTQNIDSATFNKIKNLFLENNLKFSAAKIKENFLKIRFTQKNLVYKIAEILQLDFQKYLNEKKPYLSSEMVFELLKEGHFVGSHSVEHFEYQHLTLQEQLRQTIESCNEISERFKIPYKIFSFPFTDFGVSQEFFHAISQQIELSFGCAGLKQTPYSFHFQRIPMEKSLNSAQKIISQEYLFYIAKFLAAKHKT